jgi:uncharacterized membrane protein YfcA
MITSAIAGGAILMSINHLAKIVACGLIGFWFSVYFSILILMSFGAIVGSYVGSKARKKLIIRCIIKYLLRLSAIKMIIIILVQAV